MLKEEAVMTKVKLQESNLDGFSASYGWLDGLESAYGIKEHQIVGEAGRCFSWVERHQKLTAGYISKNIRNMNKSGCFLKALPEKELVKKARKSAACK